MNFLYVQLLKRKEYLEMLLSDIASELLLAPQGNLRVRNDNGIPRYYHLTKRGDTQGKYIQKKNASLACQLAQKDYLQRLQREVEKELESINIYLSNHGEADLENVYEGLNPYRKEIVLPMIITDEMYVEQWENEQYEINPYHPEEKVYPTKKDEFVRSKSEVLLADMYCELGIPYRYEAELRLKNGKRRYPDFTLLNIKTRPSWLRSGNNSPIEAKSASISKLIKAFFPSEESSIRLEKLRFCSPRSSTSNDKIFEVKSYTRM